MSYFGVSLRNGVGLGLGTVPSLTNTPLSYRLAPSLDLSFAGSDSLSPAITFSRTTNATVTGSNGLIQNAPMNLLTFSEQFDNAAWSKAGATVIANAVVAPNGTTTADKLVATTTAGAHFLGQNNSAVGIYTFSFYAKAGEYSFCGLANNPNNYVYFDLTNGSVSTLGTGWGSASCIDVGDGWYRCSVTNAASQTWGASLIYVLNAWVPNGNTAPSFVGNNVSGIYIWGAQLEVGSTATTYNPTTVKNLLSYTENFDNAAWTKSNASISATKVDDIYGQPFAQKLVASTASSTHFTSGDATVVSGTRYTASIYVKAAEYSTVIIGFLASTGFSTTTSVLVNLAEGTVSAGTGTPLSSAIANVGNGWYRVSVVLAATASGTGSIYIAAVNGTTYADRTVAGNGTSGIYIFGAQLSDSASVDPYVYQPVAAPTSTAYYGPRFDYDPVTLQPKGLLIEEQRSNLLTYSEQFDNAAWSVARCSISANTTTAPDGTTSADSLVEDTTSNSHPVFRTVLSLTAIAYTGCCYIKSSARTQARIAFANTAFAASPYCDFDLSAVTANGANGGTGTITKLSNGWYRCTLTATAGAAGSGDMYIQPLLAGAPSYLGTGVTALYLWGAQLEAGAFATSYIPTVASQVTRTADNASMIGNNFARWYNVNTGTLFAQAIPSEAPATDGVVRFAAAIYDTVAYPNAVRLERLAGLFRDVQTVGGSSIVATSTWSTGATGKAAGAYENSNSAAVFNAGTVIPISGAVPVGVVELGIGGNSSGGNNWCGHISRIAYYPRRLANTELQGITA